MISAIRSASKVGNYAALGLVAVLATARTAGAQDGTWTKVFNGTDLAGLTKHGNGTVTVTDGMIDVSGGNGYLYTNQEYSHYRAKVEWKNVGGGNSGYLHHIDINKHACGDWPSGPELQMAKGDVGSIWTTDCKFNSTGSGLNYAETGGALTGVGQYGCSRTHFIRPTDKEKAGDWNTWEIFAKGDSLEVKVNDAVVMRISKLTMGGNVPMVKGHMGLQIEGNHVQWRNWQVMDLSVPSGIVPKARSRSLLRGPASAGSSLAAGMVFPREGLPSGAEAAWFSANGKTLSIRALGPR